MSGAPLHLPQLRSLGQTTRKDRWWVQPLLVFLGFGAFIVYSTWAAFQGVHYYLPGTGYLSPMYSPLFFDAWQIGKSASGHALFGPWPDWLPHSVILPLTPALFILWIPGAFRFTCYYYRGAYYKAFWADPLSCSVGEPAFRKTKYRGERKFPLILQNVHRYFLYLALVFVVILSIDAVRSFWFTDAAGHGSFGIGVGTLILTINPILIALYTFGCHSLRHIIGGRKDQIGEGAGRKMYDCASCLNRRHMLWAWVSLFWVGFTDVYVRLCSMGIWHDYRII
jgi:hypothetical protein